MRLWQHKCHLVDNAEVLGNNYMRKHANFVTSVVLWNAKQDSKRVKLAFSLQFYDSNYKHVQHILLVCAPREFYFSFLLLNIQS